MGEAVSAAGGEATYSANQDHGDLDHDRGRGRGCGRDGDQLALLYPSSVTKAMTVTA